MYSRLILLMFHFYVINLQVLGFQTCAWILRNLRGSRIRESSWVLDRGGSEVHCHPQLYNEFSVNLVYETTPATNLPVAQIFIVYFPSVLSKNYFLLCTISITMLLIYHQIYY